MCKEKKDRENQEEKHARFGVILSNEGGRRQIFKERGAWHEM